MRILLLTLYFKPDLAANSVIMTKLAESLVDMGHELTIVTAFPHYDTNRIWEKYLGKVAKKDVQNNITIYRVYLYVPSQKSKIAGRFLNYVSFNVLSTLVILHSGQHDVILSPSPPLTIGLSAYILWLFRRIPYVYNVQDIYPDIAIRLGILKNPLIINFFNALERFVYKHAAAVAVLSEGFRNNLLAKGVPIEKIHIIPNFVDHEFIRPLPRHNKFSQFHEIDGKYVVLFAGNIGYSQGLEFVLEAAKKLQNLPDLLFLIVGNGVVRATLVDQAKTMELKNVQFLPFQPVEDVPAMYNSADLCLVPLRRGIAMNSVPSKVYTIMAAGRPLIASVDQESDIWRFIEETGCGLCVQPEDSDALAQAILTLYKDRETAQEMGRLGRKRIEADFTPQIIAQKYSVLLEKVASLGRNKTPL
jgi:colanic acid biosynthesis glycosyl transferase WcaI